MTLKYFFYRLQLANVQTLLDLAGRLGRWALIRKLDLMGYPQRDRVAALVDREIAALGPSVEAYLTHQKTEIDILSARLSRRYDPGAALNEVTERASKAKKTAMQAHAPKGVVLSELLGRVNERVAEGAAADGPRDFTTDKMRIVSKTPNMDDLTRRLSSRKPGEMVQVSKEELDWLREYVVMVPVEPVAGHASTKGVLLSERHDDAPKPGEPDFWEKEAARQRAACEENPEPMLALTPMQEKALEDQKQRVKKLIGNA